MIYSPAVITQRVLAQSRILCVDISKVKLVHKNSLKEFLSMFFSFSSPLPSCFMCPHRNERKKNAIAYFTIG